jgi:Na+-driven multidrug efflux pump
MKNSIEKRMNFTKLAIPIFIEMLIRSFYLSIDTFMLSMYSDKAVAAVGLMSQFVFFIMIFYSMVSAGSGIYITQLLGAAKKGLVTKVIFACITLIVVLNIIITIILNFNIDNLLYMFKLESDVHHFAYDYLFILSTFSILMALNIMFSSLYKSYGYTKFPMVINFICMTINAFGNYCFIFGKFGFPILGVKGVALSTVISQGLGAAILILMAKKYNIDLKLMSPISISKDIYFKIVKVGIPNSMVNLSQNISQLVICVKL